jgi:hypothetical protein
MNEIDEALLNEYLDGTLDEDRRRDVEALLARSPEARAMLVDLKQLFADFEALSDVSLETDLSASIVADIESQSSSFRVNSRWLRFLLLGQLVVALLLFSRLWSSVPAWIENGRQAITAPLSSLDISPLLVWDEIVAWGTAVIEQINVPIPTINLPAGQWILLFALALIAWLAGNRLLFTANMNGGSHG